MFGLLQPEHLLLILVIVLIVFGAGKLPDTMRDIGRGVRSFREEADSAAHRASAPVSVPSGNVATNMCPGCSKPVPANARFCPECGHTI